MMAEVIFDNSKLFRDIAQFRSVSRGASQNGISQSAASQHIQELEKKLGISLLDRTTRPLNLTPGRKAVFRSLPRRAAPRGGIRRPRSTS